MGDPYRIRCPGGTGEEAKSVPDTARLWQAKLAAWTHDPPEKALVLFRDPAGHEGGTVAAIRTELFGGKLPPEFEELTRRADHWAAAADRPHFPGERDRLRVDFTRSPALVHPLSGEVYAIESFATDYDVERVKAWSLQHLKSLMVRTPDGDVDWKATFLGFWRLGPATPAPELEKVWAVLPADTRIPDHSIWEHLRLVSAFAGAMHGGEQPALLSVSFGPVQSYLGQARSLSDLWAGSHFLSRLSWEGMRVVCERFGPDAVLFPDLHGVPLADLWLETQGVPFPPAGEHSLERLRMRSDANPLFAAALPNRFVALVPASQGAAVAGQIRDAVRSWVRSQAVTAWSKLLEAAGMEGSSGDALQCGTDQIEAQLADFPEVHWALVPWSLAAWDEAAEKLQGADGLRRLLDTFDALNGGVRSRGFLDSDAFRTLTEPVDLEGTPFYRPNPGILYPALHDALERVLAAAKATRPFGALEQQGYRCSLCGEREWLTADRRDLEKPKGRRGAGFIWQAVSERFPSWSRDAEALCAICALKRLWPVLFQEAVEAALGISLRRYVVSTHTMALAPTLARVLESGVPDLRKLEDQVRRHPSGEWAALPRRLALAAQRSPHGDLAGRLPALLDGIWEADDGLDAPDGQSEVGKLIAEATGFKPEAYYALILMDGDRMGAWLSGDAGEVHLRDLFHPDIRSRIEARHGESPALAAYLGTRRPPSPGYHSALSAALNGFALKVAPAVLEERHLGKLLYAGGDDLLAMLGIDDVLSAMLELRLAFSGRSGTLRPGAAPGLELDGGYALLRRGGGRDLLRMMGHRATASCGVVVAHHKTPLGAVLRALKAAEQRAKREGGRDAREGGRDAFSIVLLKRSGGETRFTCPWFPPEADGKLSSADVLRDLRDAFANRLSRQAAYNTIAWLRHMPAGDSALRDAVSYRDLLRVNLEYQFGRNVRGGVGSNAPPGPALGQLASGLADLALACSPARARDFLEEAITVAEFLAREGRSGKLAVAEGAHA